MKYKDPETGEYKEIRVKGRDTLPQGAIIEYKGADIPEGYEKIEELENSRKKLKKISISELIKGYIFNSNTIQDKENNTYSANMIDEKIDNVFDIKTGQEVATNFSKNGKRVYVLNIKGTVEEIKAQQYVLLPNHYNTPFSEYDIVYFLGKASIANGIGQMPLPVYLTEKNQNNISVNTSENRVVISNSGTQNIQNLVYDLDIYFTKD